MRVGRHELRISLWIKEINLSMTLVNGSWNAVRD
jgi:hypothetical protein